MQVSVKGVLIRNNAVLLLLNERGEYELPGGRPDAMETAEQTLTRELFEETQLHCTVSDYLGSGSFEVIPGRWVFIVGFYCTHTAGDVKISPEHTDATWWPLDDIHNAALAKPYQELIEAALSNAAPSFKQQ